MKKKLAVELGKNLWLLVLFLFASAHTLAADDKKSEAKPKIVGLIQVRNEEQFVEQCLRALAVYTDAIVVVDDASDDRTRHKLRSLARELHIEQLICNKDCSWQVRDERFNRQRLLDAGREVGGTHFIFMDADEMWSAQCARNGWLRKQILAMKKGQLMKVPEVNLWGSLDYYRDDEFYSPVTTNWAEKAFVLCDDGVCNYKDNQSWCNSGIIHVSVDPVNRKTADGVDRFVYPRRLGKAIIHFKCVNLDSLATKRIWYMCLEFIRMNEKSDPSKYKENAEKLNDFYKTKEFAGMSPSDLAKMKLTPAPEKWFKYPFFDGSIYKKYNTKKQKEVVAWLKKFGPNYFADLDIWNLDWVKEAKQNLLTSRLIKHIDKEAVLKLYQLMKDTHEIFMLNKVPYWIDFGTSLGAVRNKGLIPWDDDLDISIDIGNEQKFLALVPAFEKIGYKVIKMWYGHKIYPVDGKPIQGYEHRYPFLDVFITKEDQNKIFYARTQTPDEWGKRDGGPIFITKDELYPLKQYEFGNLKLWGANNPKPYLDNCYGNDWNEVAVYSYDHAAEKWSSPIKVRLSRRDRGPAQPLGPLANRVK